jgi:hypothetical protein
VGEFRSSVARETCKQAAEPYVGEPYPGKHAIERARQRYGIVLDLAALRLLEGQIAAGRATVLTKIAEGVQRVLVTHAGKQMVAIFDHQSRKITTFLPRQGWSDYLLDPNARKAKRGKRRRR